MRCTDTHSDVGGTLEANFKQIDTALSAFVAEMICPRVLTSHADALFCCHFVRPAEDQG